jgi:hypothetical protein
MHNENSHEERPVPAGEGRAVWTRLFIANVSLVLGEVVAASILYAQAMHPELLFSPPPVSELPEPADDRPRYPQANVR